MTYVNLTHNPNRHPPMDGVPNFLRDLREDLALFDGTLIGYTFSVFPEDLPLLRQIHFDGYPNNRVLNDALTEAVQPYSTEVIDGVTVVTVRELNVWKTLIPTLLTLTTPAQVLVSKISK